MTQSTSFAQVATNQFDYLSSALCANTPPCKKHSSSRKFLTLSISLRLLLVMFLTLTVSANAWGAEEVYKETIFSSSNNSVKISSYSNSWSNTTNGFKVNITNANNNNNGWTYIKMGSKNNASTGTIITANFIDKKITKVSLNIGAITTTYVTSIKLYKSTNNSTWVEIGSFSKSKDWQNVVISDANQGTNLYYKIEAVCLKAKDNGPLQINGVKFYIEDTPVQSHTVTWTINPAAGGTLSATSGNSTTVSPNAAYTYGAPAYTVTSGAATVSQSGNTFTATPTANSTIQINMVEKPKYTVTLNAGPGTCAASVTETSAGAGVTLPTPTLDCGDWEFAGWKTTSAVSTETTTKPTLIPAGSYSPTANITLYAVYKRTETTDAGGGGGVATGTISFVNTTQRDSRTNEQQVWSNEDIIFTNNKSSSTTNVADYSNPARFYANSQIIISAPGAITQIVADCDESKYATALSNSIEDDNTVSGVNITITPSQSSNTYTIVSLSAQTRLNSLTVTYTSGGGSSSTTYYHSTPDCDPSCDDAVTISKGTETNGIFTLSTTGQQSTCDGLVIVTLSNIQPATGYQFSEITQSGVDNAKVTINNTDKTVSYAKNATGTSTINVTFTPAVCTINYKDQGDVAFSGTHEEGYPQTHTYNTATTLKSASKDYYNFVGWYKESDCSGTAVTKLGATEYTNDITLYAKWTANTYTITFNAGTGECGTESVATTNASGVTLPTATHTCTDWTFAGWWTEEVLSSTNTSPGTLMKAGDTYNPTSDITLYAVYSTQEAGDAFTGYAKVTTAPDDWSGKYLLSTGTYTANGTYDSNGANGHLVRATYTPGNEEKADWEFTLAKVGNTGYSILFPDGSFYLGYASSTNFQRSTIDPSQNVAYLWTPSTSGITNVSATSRKIADNGDADFRPYSSPSSGIVYLYKRVGGGTITTYNSNPTCLVPVWDGATIDKTNLTVNCGERSSMDGAAKITFSKDKIFDFSNPITIEASEGFLVSTSRTPNENYQQSVSQSPLVGTEYPNTFNGKFVYVRAEAPAQSDTDLEGTITIKNSKGETLQTFSVTADVTCTQYTLTLVDRGVSTEQPTKYYAGETIDEAPADPEGVCTDPIHYVFDGWAEATVAEGSTTYTKVTFPYTVEGNTKFYAVYRYVEDGSADSGDYMKVTENLDDYSGDYLIVYETGNVAFDGGLDELDGTSNTIEVTIDNNTIESNATTDAAKFTIAKVDGGYSIQSTSGYYIGRSATSNGLSTNETYSANYDLNTITDCKTIKGKGGNILKYNKAADQKRFRYYQSGQETIALYRKAASYLYTTSPICGPHLAITEGKNIYVTGGNAGGTRDLVIAQQKVSYKATRLQTSNGLADGTAPDVKVATNGITIDGVVTSDVKVTIDQTKEQQTDGTYTITGTITVQYQPSANNKQEDIQVQLAVDYNTDAKDNFTVHARSLPSEFVIVAKSGDKWYALNADMSSSKAQPANGQVTLDNDANPTKATYAPCNTIYTFDGLPNTGDRTYVRFQGTDGAWLWASSGSNVGIQNNVLKTTPEGSNKAYNWKLYTEDNITYRFGNANSSRQLTLSGEKFGMYASAVQDIRILPYEAKCLYNYAPTNLKVSVLKGTYVTLTWDAVIGATKYQYSTNGTTWTDAGAEPTVTINNLKGATEYTYYIRAYHEDAGVSQECIDYAEITFTTANCDDVPTDITYSANLNSITVSWTAAAPTATITYNTKEDGTGGGGTINNATSPYKISGGLNKNTTYYIQILADGTCASPIIPVKTEDVEVDIVEWDPQGIIVDINTDETIGVTLENEVSFGSGLGTEATELFFSKYYEASYNVKLVAIYNGTKNIIDLTDYTIQYGKTSWETNYITLKDFGATKGQIQPGEEIILYSYTENNADDKKILDCVHDAFPDGNWVRVTSSNNDGEGTLSFGGDKTIILCKTEYDDEADEYYDNIIDVIGALKEDPNEGILPTNENTEKPSWGDKEGWVCETGLSIADDSQIGISTNRCLLVRNNTVTSGSDAVEQNLNGDFVTLCSEWKGAQVPDSDIDNGLAASCENFAYVGTFDYSDYYTKFVPMGESSTFDENARNADGTVTIPITDLYKHACSNIRVKLTNSNGDVLTDREYKVPIMITTTQGTDGQTFLDLQQNLATKEVDGEGNVINTYPLSLDEVREICKTCDVVVRDNATLTKVADGTTNDHPQVHDVIVYEGASIVIPDGNNHNYTINSLSLRRKGDDVASAQVQGTGKLVLPADVPVTLNMRIDANNWHWFTLPYDCDIEDVTWSDGTPTKYNTDWFLMYYDGESRAASTNPHDNHWKVYSGTTIEAGKGYIIGITGDLAHPNYTFELCFPMEQDVLTAEQTNKTVALNAWGVKSDNTPNNKGWNLVGNPYLNYYQPETEGFSGLSLLKYTGIHSVTGDRLYDNSGNVPFLVTPIDGGWYEYQQELASDVQMMPFTAYFVQVGNPATHENGQALEASFKTENRAPKSLQARRNASEENSDPAIVAVSLTNAKGESDKTTLLIADHFTSEYEMNADFFKWFGDYYKYYTKPVLYTIGADQGKRAFNALNEDLATQPISLGMYAAQAGNYTFSLNLRNELAQVQEVWLYDATQDVYTNLLQDDYTFHTAKTESAGRFFLSVKMAPKVTTDTENLTSGSVWATTHNKTITINGLLSNSHVWVYDATGKLLHADQTQYFQHSFSVPQTGAYFVRVQNTMQTQTIKVVVE